MKPSSFDFFSFSQELEKLKEEVENANQLQDQKDSLAQKLQVTSPETSGVRE